MRYGVYVHIPFCRQKCPYCDFVSFPGIPDDVVFAYVKALTREIAYWSDFVDSPAYTFYLGGGTPSLLAPKYLSCIVEALYKTFGEPSEFTVEANPEDLTPENMRFWKGLGVNRLSVGLQTADSRLLAMWKRSTADMNLMEKAREMFTLNLDLIYPLYLPVGWKYDVSHDLDVVAKLLPHHLSWYVLELHPGTRLARLVDEGKWVEIDEDTFVAHWGIIYENLTGLGYIHYEISNWALPRYQSKHNLGYWEGRPYIGLGLATSGFYAGLRWNNTISLRDYIEGRWRDGVYRPVGREILVEIGAFALRMLQQGLSRELWERYGGDFDLLRAHAREIDGVVVEEDKIVLREEPGAVLISNVIIGEVLAPWL